MIHLGPSSDLQSSQQSFVSRQNVCLASAESSQQSFVSRQDVCLSSAPSGLFELPFSLLCLWLRAMMRSAMIAMIHESLQFGIRYWKSRSNHYSIV
jgi:hypothetical protein